MSTYLVGVKIVATQQVEADSAEEAEQVVREMELSSLLQDADFEVPYIEEVQA